MGHVLKLLRGSKTSPTRTFEIASDTSTSNIYLRRGGFSGAAGQSNVVYSGRTSRFDGEQRITSSRDNVTMTINYDLFGGSAGEISYLQRQIERFALEVKLYHEERVGEKTWLEFRWQEGLVDVAAPVLGQWSYYYQVLDIEVDTWPDSAITNVIAGNVENIEMRIVCAPYAEGLRDQLFHADDLADTGADVTMQRTMSASEFASDFTLSGWIDHRASNYYVFEYYVDASNYLLMYWHQSNGRFEVLSRVAASDTTTTGNSLSFSVGDAIHIAVVQDHVGDSDTTIFINASEQTNNGTSNAWSNSGTLTLGKSTAFSATTGQTNGLDAWRMWTSALTAANITSLYNVESDVKGDGNTIQPPPWLKSRSGDGVFENVDGILSTAAKDNWGVAGWIPGTVEALTEWQINLQVSGGDVLWLGRKATTTAYTPDLTHWLDFSGTADVGNSSGDAYETDTSSGSGTDTHDYDATLNEIARTRGRVQVLARFKVTGTTITANAYYRLGTAEMIKGDDVSIAANASWFFRDLGDIIIDWPSDGTPTTMIAGILITETEAVAAVTSLDFVQLLPYPFFRVEAESAFSFDATDYLVVQGREAHLHDVGDDSTVERFDFRGEPVNLVPYHYNYIYALRGEDGVAFVVGETNLVTVFVTPRYVLPGGLS